MRTALMSSVLFLPLLAGCGSDPAQASSMSIAAPLGLEKLELVKPLVANPLTAEKAQLGKMLFFDPRLSGSGKMGCVNCHYPDKAFTDGIAHSVKDNGKKNGRNAPTMYNVGYYPDLYWDGRKQGLEANVLAAWTGQLDGKPQEVAEKLNENATYKRLFEGAFGKEASEETVVQALSAFLRALRSGDSAYDKAKAGDDGAMSADAKAGEQLFTSKGCATCHTPPLFSDRLYHNVGIGMAAEAPDLGRANHTKQDADNGRFKTPTLRDVAKTAPYFHDGSVATLEEAVRLMAGGGIDNPNKDPLLTMKHELSDDEVRQLVAFLESLSGTTPFAAPKLPE